MTQWHIKRVLIGALIFAASSIAYAGMPAAPAAIPVLDSWGLIGLSVLAALLGMRNLFKKR